ncbi:dephospho-CoA kinase [Neptuniibacter sp. CAU 1671]|uniref:dephospho-CoA kinase n=1 Tax=Neptuniibacter sp. CAU 1671 TaxID=3032593 RepID=UPI0023DC1B2D|nr:dephospho-CoA kinase [Neptuniibacter sp. CAU 1671]MDF2181551.1 dephospho-CoA kinase [Neptuniibacter sp. CAU 1671]
MKKPFTVGLTGGIGSGKTALSDALRAKGISIVDADIVAREVVAPGTDGLDAVAQHFGNDILLPDQSLNRAALRQIIFKHPEERAWLESVLHPLIRERILNLLSQPTNSFHILSSPLLLETDQHTLVDYIVVVDVPEALQVERTQQRDNNTPEQIEAIMQAQLPRSTRCAKADFIIDNSGDLQQLETEVTRLMTTLNRELSARNENE